MKLFNKNNLKYLLGVPVAIVIIVGIFIRFSPYSNATNFQANAAWTSTSTGNWNYPVTWGLHGGLPSFTSPTIIAVGPSDRMYVHSLLSGLSGNYITILNSDGTASTSFSIASLSPGGYFTDMAVSSIGEIYAVDSSGNIAVVNGNGTASTTYTAAFANIFLTSNKTIYGVNNGANKVQVLSPGGAASSTEFSSIYANYQGSGTGTSTPLGVAVAADGKVYVVDYFGSQGHNRLVVYNPNGTVYGTYNASGEVWGFSYVIGGVGIAPNGKIYISAFTQDPDTFATITEYIVLNTDFTLDTIYTTNPATYFSKPVFTSTGKIAAVRNAAGYRKALILNSDGSLYANYNGQDLPPSFVPTQGTDYPGPTDYATIDRGTVTLTTDQTIGTLVLSTGGTLDLNGHTLTIATGGSFSNTGGTINANGGRIVFSGVWASAASGNWASSTTWGGSNPSPVEGVDYPGINDDARIIVGTTTLSQNQNVRNITLDSGGVLDLAGHTLNVAGNWTNSGGTLARHPGNEGTANLVATGNQSILGSNIFENLVKTANSVATLSFDTNSSTTVTHTLSLSGSATHYLVLSPTGYIPPAYISTFGSDIFLGVTTDSASNIYTYSRDGNNIPTVTKYDSNGNVLQTIDNTHYNCGALSGIDSDLKVDSDDNLYVINPCSLFGDSSFSKFDSSGNWIFTSTTTMGSGDGQLGQYAGSIAVDSQHNIYVADRSNNRIEVFNPDGTYKAQFGTYGSGDGQFFAPLGVAIDANDKIYVVDTNNSRIQVFNSDYSFSFKFGTSGNLSGQFNGPYHGIFVDASGYIYVGDSNNNRVQIFNPDGTYKAQFGSVGTGNTQFRHPQGIAIDPTGRSIYIADTSNHRIVKYGYLNSPIFYIAHQTESTSPASLSYLSVNGSVNISSGLFNCNSCVDGGANASWIFVGRGPSRAAPRATSISISPLNPTLVSGATTTFSAALLDQYSAPFTTSIIWSAPSSTVGIIGSSTGLFTATSSGSTIIFATTGSLVASTTVTVTAANILATSTATTTQPLATTTPIIPVAKKSKTSVSTTTLPNTPTTINSTDIIFLGTVATSTGTSTTASATGSSTPTVQSSTQNIIADFTNTISSAITASAPLQTVSGVVNSDIGSAVTKTISTTGVVAGAGAVLTAATFANPITFAEIWLIPTRIFGLLVGALGIRRKNRPWGTVYDSVTKRPLDPAYVTLFDIATGKEVATAITDLDGRYSFSVLPGKYKIVAQKTNYIPSVKMAGQAFDEVYTDLYFGTDITIEHEGEVITKNIPLDPQGFDWNEFAKNKMNINTFVRERDITWAKVSRVIFIVGFFVSLFGLIFSPAPYNAIIAVSYVAAYALNYFVFKVKKAGSLTDKATNTPLSFAIVKIFKEGETTPILKKIADQFGRYYSLVPKGNYTIEVDKKNDDATYSEAWKSGVVMVKNGVINMDVKI